MIRPAGHRILVRPDRVERITKSGIHLPDEAHEREERAARTGIVLAVGPTAWKNMDDGTPWAAVGDRVFFRQYSSANYNNGEANEWIINDEDVLGVIEEKLELVEVKAKKARPN